MPRLAELQRHMAAEILGSSMPSRSGIEVHRNTIIATLVNALRLSCPTVAQLTGAACFERLAADYARSHPPRAAVLYLYGDGFPDYLRSAPDMCHLPYIPDMARFDLGIERAAHQPAGTNTRAIEIDASLRIRLVSSLICLQVDYPVDLIRDAMESGRPTPLVNLDLTPRARHFALWRGASGPTVRRLSPMAARFLTTLLAGGDATEAMQCADEPGTAAAEEVIATIQTEVLAASFTQLSWHSRSGASR